jgi:hypothetical protein
VTRCWYGLTFREICESVSSEAPYKLDAVASARLCADSKRLESESPTLCSWDDADEEFKCRIGSEKDE